MIKVDVGNFIPWNEMVRKYAMSHNVDLTTAAFDIKKKLEALGELEFIQKEIKRSEAYWYALCDTTRDYQMAIKDLIYLRQTGFGKRELKILSGVIKGKRLDEELITEEELQAIGYRIRGKNIISIIALNSQMTTRKIIFNNKMVVKIITFNNQMA